MAMIEVDPETDQYLEFAAGIEGITKGEVVARLVTRIRQLQSAPDTPATLMEPVAVQIYADYAGHRTRALFHPGPGGIEILTGDLAGQAYRTPSEAARAVVHQLRPEVRANRNGWNFWALTASGAPLQTIRRYYR